jgi:hypothetical protein
MEVHPVVVIPEEVLPAVVIPVEVFPVVGLAEAEVVSPVVDEVAEEAVLLVDR